METCLLFFVFSAEGFGIWVRVFWCFFTPLIVLCWWVVFFFKVLPRAEVGIGHRIMICDSFSQNGPYLRRGNVAQWLEHGKSNPKTVGSIHWRGRVRHRYWFFFSSIPPSQLLCRLVCALTPLRVYAARTQMCVHVKDPISNYRKRVGLVANSIEHENTAQRGKKTFGVAPYYSCSLFSSKAGPVFA